MTSSLTVAFVAVVASVVVSHDGGSSVVRWYRPVSNRGRIYVAGLIPLTSHAVGDDWGVHIDKPAPDVLPAILMARDDVNRNRRILPNHELDLVWNDTEVCDSSRFRRFHIVLIAIVFVQTQLNLYWSVSRGI